MPSYTASTSSRSISASAAPCSENADGVKSPMTNGRRERRRRHEETGSGRSHIKDIAAPEGGLLLRLRPRLRLRLAEVGGDLFGLAAILLLLIVQPTKALIPEFLSYKTCVDSPPSFMTCMSNVTADYGQRVVLNCQVNPRCMVQFLHWYHAPLVGEKRLLKTSKNAYDPYVHTIERVTHATQGRYSCFIRNVGGETECAAYVTIRDAATPSGGGARPQLVVLLLLALAAASKRMLRVGTGDG